MYTLIFCYFKSLFLLFPPPHQGCICKSPCSQVRWVPGSPSLFLVSFADGSIITFDKERDDGPFIPGDPDLSPPVVQQFSSPSRTAGGSGATDVQPLSLTGAALAASSDITNAESTSPSSASKSQPQQPPQLTPLTTQIGNNINSSNTLLAPILSPSSPSSMSATSPQTNSSNSPSYLAVTGSPLQSTTTRYQTLSSASTLSPTQRKWDPREEIFVTVPSWYAYGAGGGLGSGLGSAVVSPGGGGSVGRSEKVMKNPISHWKISRKSVLGKGPSSIGCKKNCRLYLTLIDFVFSPDLRYVAAVSEDGCLRVIDTLSEK